MVRAKFVVVQKSEDGKDIRLLPVVDGSEENKSFFEATPSGEINLNIVNQAASKELENGVEYYVDFTKAE
jgi:hypothetical protein